MMSSNTPVPNQSKLRRTIVIAAFAALATPFASSRAQVPTPAEAAKLLQTRPDLVAEAQARIKASGMSDADVRARLKAMGYAPNLFDPYLGSAVKPDSAPPVSADVMNAFKAIGFGDLTQKPKPLAEIVPPASPAVAATAAPVVPEFGALPIFGMELFTRASSQFDAMASGSVDASYRVGPHDVLVLVITGDVEASYPLEVSQKGSVVIPQVGEVYVANLTLGEIQNLFLRRLSQLYSGIGAGSDSRTRFSVTIGNVRTNQVFVVGDATVPSSYQISGLGTMLTAVYAAGGPTVRGSMRQIQLKRRGQVISTLDMYDYILRGDATRDSRLETGDMIFVPFHGKRVAIRGEVGRAAVYELKEGETLADLISFAGGFKATASRSRVQITRVIPPNQRTEAGKDREVIDVSAQDFMNGLAPRLALADDDQIDVFPVNDRVRNRIVVEGGVWQSGPQGFTAGMKLSDALNAAGGIRPDAYIGEILISRRQPDETRRQLRAQLLDGTGRLASNMTLEEDDEIRVFTRTEFVNQREVSIAGSVRTPSRFGFREGMTLRDVVQLAGGLTENAYLGYAEIARLPEDRGGSLRADTIRVQLDSSFLFASNDRVGGARAPTAGDLQLKPSDRIVIFRKPGWEPEQVVTIDGQVRFPSTYVLRTRDERISDLVERAGGLAADAYPDGATFTRSADNSGRINIDLQKLLRDPTSRENFVLQAGDALSIPKFIPTVRVQGAVNAPSSVAYSPGRKLEYYIAAAGGLTEHADKSRAYVTQPNGFIEPVKNRPWFIPDGYPEPKPGASIFVPATDGKNVDWHAVATAVAQVVASMTAVIIVAVRK